MVREACDAGLTFVPSFRVLTEIEAVADVVGVLHHGRLAVVDTVETLKARAARRIDLTFTGKPPTDVLAAVEGVSELSVDGPVMHLVVEGSTADLISVLTLYRGDDIVAHEADLLARPVQ